MSMSSMSCVQSSSSSISETFSSLTRGTRSVTMSSSAFLTSSESPSSDSSFSKTMRATLGSGSCTRSLSPLGTSSVSVAGSTRSQTRSSSLGLGGTATLSFSMIDSLSVSISPRKVSETEDQEATPSVSSFSLTMLAPRTPSLALLTRSELSSSSYTLSSSASYFPTGSETLHGDRSGSGVVTMTRSAVVVVSPAVKCWLSGGISEFVWPVFLSAVTSVTGLKDRDVQRVSVGSGSTVVVVQLVGYGNDAGVVQRELSVSVARIVISARTRWSSFAEEVGAIWACVVPCELPAGQNEMVRAIIRSYTLDWSQAPVFTAQSLETYTYLAMGSECSASAELAEVVLVPATFAATSTEAFQVTVAYDVPEGSESYSVCYLASGDRNQTSTAATLERITPDTEDDGVPWWVWNVLAAGFILLFLLCMWLLATWLPERRRKKQIRRVQPIDSGSKYIVEAFGEEERDTPPVAHLGMDLPSAVLKDIDARASDFSFTVLPATPSLPGIFLHVDAGTNTEDDHSASFLPHPDKHPVFPEWDLRISGSFVTPRIPQLSPTEHATVSFVASQSWDSPRAPSPPPQTLAPASPVMRLSPPRLPPPILAPPSLRSISPFSMERRVDNAYQRTSESSRTPRESVNPSENQQSDTHRKDWERYRSELKKQRSACNESLRELDSKEILARRKVARDERRQILHRLAHDSAKSPTRAASRQRVDQWLEEVLPTVPNVRAES
eukprot:NODE_301_length_2490_cov_20.781647_g278_i0.p1 GENE.NODE_301_length_2490_cov_20.781647_g278_i0~~NODE_301_length_2490_cov_20.781647_g278_i0.p1  ORF type:complete len:726 (-),score=94.04 NODE_301_length_2490_cov_20.781647_g278_i0:50-2227(-)